MWLWSVPALAAATEPNSASTGLSNEDHPPVCTGLKAVAQRSEEVTLPKVELIRQLPLHSAVTALAWSPDGRLLATSEDFDRVVKIWDAADFRILSTVRKQNKGSGHLLFTADNRYLITSSIVGYDGINRVALSLIDAATGQIARNIDGPNDPSSFARANVPSDFVLSPDGRTLYVAFNTRNRIVYAYDTSSWSSTGSFRSAVAAMAGGPGNDQLTVIEIGPATNMRNIVRNNVPTVVFDSHFRVRVWRAGENRSIHEFEVPANSPWAIALDRTACRLAIGDSLAIAQETDNLTVWDMNLGNQLDAVKTAAPIKSLALNPEGTLLAIADDKAVILADLGQLATSQVVKQFDNYALGATFDQSGRRLAVAGDQSVIIYELR
jgi:WD40 repeat protein